MTYEVPWLIYALIIDGEIVYIGRTTQPTRAHGVDVFGRLSHVRLMRRWGSGYEAGARTG